MITKEQIAQTLGQFSWDYGQQFFIETAYGNFTWNDPDYDGDNVLSPYKGTLCEYLKGKNQDMVRYKGSHMIGKYCGNFIWKEETVQ